MITAIANQKGGVAKTTSTLALGGLLAEEGSCLVIDLDPQGNLTTGLGIELAESQPTIYEVLTSETTAKEAIVPTPFDLSLLPATATLAQAENKLLTQPDRCFILKEKLKPLRRTFDYILIDCPPSMGVLTANALCAANALLIPVQCQVFALKGVEGLMKTVNQIKGELNPKLKVLGVLPTMAETNTLITQEVLKTLKHQLEGVTVFEPVPKSVKFPESNLAGKPIHRYANEWKLIQPYRQVIWEMRAM
ncbi:MAG: ParA family protein [Leptolyngbyaceae cyanobacterium SL_7_1]|nr:ParA family protein [Leptolyngbyaceae cyanobacterium SL_7_1]